MQDVPRAPITVAMALTLRAWQQGRLAPPWRVHIGAPLGWDLAFLALGAILRAVGATLSRLDRPRPPGVHIARS